MDMYDQAIQCAAILLTKQHHGKTWSDDEYILYHKCVRNMDLVQDYNAVIIRKATRDARKLKANTRREVTGS